jgi:hypothetical protein
MFVKHTHSHSHAHTLKTLIISVADAAPKKAKRTHATPRCGVPPPIPNFILQR